MERKNPSSSSSSLSSCSQQIDFYLPDEYWESIFKFIINHEEDYNNRYDLNSLSLVSKKFLSITNRLLVSLTLPYKSPSSLNFKRFTNLNSLKLRSRDLGKIILEISCFPFKHLTSLDLSYHSTIPAIELRAFSQKITTLTSLNCSHIKKFNKTDLFLIAECFPLLEELDISFPFSYENYTRYVDGFEALSLALLKLRKINIRAFPINNQSLFHLFNNCKLLQEVIMSGCYQSASALPERPTLRSLTLMDSYSDEVLATSNFIESLVRMKGLTCLVLKYLKISNELLYSIARECLPLTKLDLEGCTMYSYNGIFCLLSKCQRVRHLGLQINDFLTDQHVVQLSSLLGDLVSINLSKCNKLTISALFALTRNCPSLSEIQMQKIENYPSLHNIKMERIRSDIVGGSNSLGEFGVYPRLQSLYLGQNSWLRDENIIMFASLFPNLQRLDLNDCNFISEGICQVLKRCSKIRHLNLSYCSDVKLIGVNFVVPKLEVLNLSATDVDDDTLYGISKSCCGLLMLSLKHCNGVTEKGLKHMVENCTQLRWIMAAGIHISDKNKELFKRHRCNVYNYSVALNWR